MRWLFLFVLFLNLAYIGWQKSQSPVDSYVDIAPLKDVTSIVLLSELESQPDSFAVAEKMMVEKVELEPSMQVATKTSVKEQPLSVQEIVEPPSVSQEPVEENKMTNVEEKVPEVVAVLANDSVDQCFTVGPFRNLDVLSGLTQDIKPYVTTTSFRSSEKSESTVYWVYIKPEKNRKKAIEVGKRLKSKKIKDFYVIRDGEKINGLSLGHFRNKNGAYGLTKKVKNLGFNVQVELMDKKYTLYWLDYQLAQGKKVPAPVVEKYMKSAKKEKITHLGRDCEA